MKDAFMLSARAVTPILPESEKGVLFCQRVPPGVAMVGVSRAPLLTGRDSAQGVASTDMGDSAKETKARAGVLTAGTLL